LSCKGILSQGLDKSAREEGKSFLVKLPWR